MKDLGSFGYNPAGRDNRFLFQIFNDKLCIFKQQFSCFII